MPDLITTLLLWTLANTPYHVTGQPSLLLTPTNRTELTGAYEDGSDMIFVADVPAAKPDNVRFQAIVVHELVHWLQDKSGRFTGDTTCPTWQKREREAFDLQRRYLLAHGARPGPAPALQCFP